MCQLRTSPYVGGGHKLMRGFLSEKIICQNFYLRPPQLVPEAIPVHSLQFLHPSAITIIKGFLQGRQCGKQLRILFYVFQTWKKLYISQI